MMSVGKILNFAAIVMGAALFCVGGPAYGQFDAGEKAGLSWGLRGGVLKPHTELTDDPGLSASTYLRFGLLPRWQLELSGGFGEYKGSAYDGLVSTAEARLLLALDTFGNANPFIYAGGGALYYDVSDLPPEAVPGYKNKGWTPTIPAGGGLRIRLTENVAIEGTVDFTYTYRDDINGAPIKKGNDVLWRVGGGITVGHFGRASQRKMPDRLEIPEPPAPSPAPVPRAILPSPEPADPDNDGAEVKRGSDPLDTADDVPRAEPDGLVPMTVYFEPGVFWLTEGIRGDLDGLATWLSGHPEVEVLLRGHSDSSSRSDYNLWLSRQRARVIRVYLTEKGISPRRLTSEGVGDREPAASNATEEGRGKNRRVEITVKP
jgi:outer membrane protein OmpA-like peptidoglycan-associated protein